LPIVPPRPLPPGRVGRAILPPLPGRPVEIPPGFLVGRPGFPGRVGLPGLAGGRGGRVGLPSEGRRLGATILFP